MNDMHVTNYPNLRARIENASTSAEVDAILEEAEKANLHWADMGNLCTQGLRRIGKIVDETFDFAHGEIVKLKTGKIPAFIPAKVMICGNHTATVRDNGGLLQEVMLDQIEKADADYQAKNADWF